MREAQRHPSSTNTVGNDKIVRQTLVEEWAGEIEVGFERAELAAARVRAVGRRAEQLRERLDRLQAGVLPTRMDVDRAKAAADAQRIESVNAQQRLLLAYAAAGNLRRLPIPTARRDGSGRVAQSDGQAPPDVRALAPDPAQGVAPGLPKSDFASGPEVIDDQEAALRRLGGENRLLRDSFVSIASIAGENGQGWPRDQYRELWKCLVDQCGLQSWEGWAHALCITATSMNPGVRGVAISGYDSQSVPHVLAVTDEWTRQVEEIHQLVGEGPAVEAYGAQVPVVVRRLADEQGRWPGYVPVAAEAGLTGLSALPIKLNGLSLGSLTLYRCEGTGTGRDDTRTGIRLAAVATRALLADLDAVDNGASPWHAGERQIQVAVGILSVQLGATPDEALALMRAFAFSNARGLGHVAEAIVDGSLRLV